MKYQQARKGQFKLPRNLWQLLFGMKTVSCFFATRIRIFSHSEKSIPLRLLHERARIRTRYGFPSSFRLLIRALFARNRISDFIDLFIQTIIIRTHLRQPRTRRQPMIMVVRHTSAMKWHRFVIFGELHWWGIRCTINLSDFSRMRSLQHSKKGASPDRNVSLSANSNFASRNNATLNRMDSTDSHRSDAVSSYTTDQRRNNNPEPKIYSTSPYRHEPKRVDAYVPGSSSISMQEAMQVCHFFGFGVKKTQTVMPCSWLHTFCSYVPRHRSFVVWRSYSGAPRCTDIMFAA